MRLINHHIHRGASLMAVMAVMAAAPSIQAQRQQLAPREIAQISDEVLRVVVPPDRSLSGLPASSRQLAFDFRRTLTAFGAAGSDTLVGLKRKVTAASQSVLSDCSYMDKKPCAHLGWRAYVWIEPLSVTDSDATVRANVSWAARGRTPFVPGSAPAGQGYLEAFSTTLHLIRNSNGVWVVDKELKTIAA